MTDVQEKENVQEKVQEKVKVKAQLDEETATFLLGIYKDLEATLESTA